MSVVFLGVLIATSLIAAAPVYLDALERQSVHNAVDSAVARSGVAYFDIDVGADFIPLDSDALEKADAAQAQALEANAGALMTSVRRYLQTPYYSISLPRLVRAAAASEDSDGESGEAWIAEGFFHSLDGVSERLTFLEGGPPSGSILAGADGDGPMIEALVGARTAADFGGLEVGEIVAAAPSSDSPVALSARIVGVVEAADAGDPYWRNDAEALLYPRVPTSDGVVTEDSPPALGLIADGDALTAALRSAFPGATVDATWRGGVDADVLKTRSRGEMRAAMDGLRYDLSNSLPDAFAFSGIDVMLARFGRQSFLSSVPLLLLMAVVGVAALYFLFMAVSYLAPSREGDVALFRSRGASGWRLGRLYLAEGAMMVVVAALIAPIPAMLAVWLAGLLPYFSDITGGATLPVRLSWTPFAAAGASAVLCLIIFVVPGALGARAGLTDQRIRAARPPAAPFVQRYYLDAMLLVVGGALFWELEARGEIAAGGLFGQGGVNEALLIAPALFLIAVGLLFFRAFPMFARYVGGESAALVHLTAGAALPALAAGIAFAEIRAGDPTGWIPESAILAGVGAAYRGAASGSGGARARAVWIALQAALVAALFYMRPPDADGYAVIFVGSLALAALVPAQILFYLLAWLARRAPAWASVSVWNMARNPTRYSWLALMLVLNGGASVLAATAGATLDRSGEERIRYAAGADIRVHSLQSYLGRRDGGIERRFGDIPEIESISIALRENGRVGAGGGGPSFTYLAVDADKFDAWHRDDFSDAPLDALLASLNAPDFGIPVPLGTDEFRLWAKPASRYSRVFLWLVVQGADGRVDTLSFGETGRPQWSLMSVEAPDAVKQPMKVLSIQINEPGFGAVGTVGEIAFDDLQAVSRANGGEAVSVVEDFEGAAGAWIALPTTDAGGDEVVRTSEDARAGGGAALFRFGKETNRGVRGVYRADGGGFIPAIASSTFLAANGAAVGDSLLVDLPGGIVPVRISGAADYFSTMDPAGGGFLVFDTGALLTYVDALSAVGETPANEVFMNVRAGGGVAALREVDRRVVGRGEAIGADAELAARAADPLASAGWRLMSLVALGVVLVISALGFLVYLLSFAERGAGETAALRSLGLSRAQAVGILAVENGAVALAGLGIGTWAGFQMSRIIVSAVAVGESGGRALPPFILSADWTLIAPLYAAIIGVFALCLTWFGRRAFEGEMVVGG